MGAIEAGTRACHPSGARQYLSFDSPGRRSKNQRQRHRHHSQRWTYTMNVLPKGASSWCAMDGGDRQNVQSPYCSDACWHKHAKEGRDHAPADTRAWTDKTTKAIWKRGRLTEVYIAPRNVGAIRVNIGIGDPLYSVFEQQRREQEDLLRHEDLRHTQVVEALTQHQPTT
jgi:hypothetical protein